jgi:hypothetical protein
MKGPAPVLISPLTASFFVGAARLSVALAEADLPRFLIPMTPSD